MRIATAIVFVFAAAVPTMAQARDVDADGANHAMTGRRHHHRSHHVRIPRHIRHVRHFGIQLPPGTSRPGSSRNFIPAR